MITKKLSIQIESAIAQSHASITKKYEHGQMLKLKYGGAYFSGKESPFSQVIGWGFDPVDIDMLEPIEAFYLDKGVNICPIELSAFSGNLMLQKLTDRGYKCDELNQISILPMDQYTPVSTQNQCIVKHVAKEDLDHWATTIADGFSDHNLKDIFKLYAMAENVFAFGAWIDTQLCGGGTIAFSNTVADLGVSSTLPKFRGQGIQKALLKHRLDFAQKHGISVASVTTEPGSISDANIQKIGFQPAYTRIKMQKQLFA